MIFDSLDLQVLGRVIMRKGCETAKVTFEPGLSDIQRYRWVDEIVKQIARARAMANFARNDFSTICSQSALFSESVSFMPPWMYDMYISGLSERDSADEKRFIMMNGELIRQIPLIKIAMREADKGIGSDLFLIDSDILMMDRLRKLVGRLSF